MIHRLAETGDFAAIAAITNHYIQTTAIHFGYAEVTAEELRSLWQKFESRYPWLVADLDGEVVGYAKAGVYRAREAYNWITESGIYLAAAHCGKGYGRPLYQRLIAVLRAQGFHSVIGGATMPNDASVKLHEALGFASAGTVREAGWKRGRWHDVGFWQLRLQPERTEPGELRTPAAAFAAAAE